MSPTADDAGVEIEAGALRAVLTDGELTSVTVGSAVLLDSVYCAVRDADWGTVPSVTRDFEISRGEDSLRARFTVVHEQGDIAFTWDGDIEANGSGVVFSMTGIALSTFSSNRIGVCLLHPQALAGSPVVVATARGGPEALRFPVSISAHQPFPEHHGMTYGDPGAQLRIDLDGQVFETEDQRNWTDPSFKTYCPPLRIGYPRVVTAGDRIVQRVVLTPERGEGAGRPPRPRPRAAAGSLPIRVDLGTRGRPLPPIGFGVSSQGGPLTASETAALRQCGPAHVAAEVAAGESHDLLVTAGLQARDLSALLHVSAVVESPDEVHEVVSALVRLDAPVGRLLVFRRSTSTTDAELVVAARSALLGAGLPDVRVGGGSRANFAELNRASLPLTDIDFVSFAVTPQVHAFDDESVMRTLLVQDQVLTQATELARGKPVAVGPVTLRPRFNAVATGTGRPREPDSLPPEVDVRQPTWFTAAWALGSVVALRGADGLTYFETAGMRGLVARDDASAGSPAFPADAGELFPVHTLFACLARGAGAPVVAAHLIEDGPARAAVLATASSVPEVVDVLVADLAGLGTPLRLDLGGGRLTEARMLGDDAELEADLRTGRIVLPPYRIARITVRQG